MDMFDLFTGEEISVSEEEIVSRTENTRDYIRVIPHPGTLLPSSLKDKFKIDKSELTVRDADLFTDEVYDIEKGVAVCTRLNRYVVNMNRYRNDAASTPENLEEFALQGFLMDGSRAWKEDLEGRNRQLLLDFYNRFHFFIQDSIKSMKEEKGFALVFDCHSMNAEGRVNTPDDGEPRPDFDIGTNNGQALNPKITGAFVDELKDLMGEDCDIRLDDPYYGGYIPQFYGCPEDDVHVLMIEINKKNYMDEEELERKPEKIENLREQLGKAMDVALEEAERVYS